MLLLGVRMGRMAVQSRAVLVESREGSGEGSAESGSAGGE